MKHDDEVERIVRRAAEVQGRSLGFYWPADEDGWNDLCEANLSLHFAYSLLGEGFAVFAEANHPQRSIRGIDLLAISSDRTWFLACEFKRHVGSTTERSRTDLDRLVRFTLNSNLREERCGKEVVSVLQLCSYGIGLVGGLNWQGKHSTGALRHNIGQQEIAEKVVQWGGQVAAPLLVRRCIGQAAPGAYYLQHAYFPLPIGQPIPVVGPALPASE